MSRLLPATLWFAAVSMLLSLSLGATAAAQAVELTPDPMEDLEATSNAPGAYAGVKPGGEQLPAIAATPGSTPAQITWPGFQMRPDGGSRVFLQTTSPVTTQTHNSGRSIVLDLGNAQIAGDTNALPLDTRFFNTPVTRIALKRDKGRLKLVLSLRTSATPTVANERAASGFHFIYIDFPPGNYIGQSPLSAAPPSPDEPASDSKTPPSQRKAPGHLSPSARGKARVDTSLDGELPPGMGEVKATGKASSSKKKGKASGKVEGKAGFSL